MIKYVTSRKNKIVLDTIELRQNKNSQKEKRFIIEGNHLLTMANNCHNLVYVLTNQRLKNIDENVDQYIVTNDILKKISINKSVPNVIGVCNYVNDVISDEGSAVYLDNVQDPGNLGTIFRSSLAFSVYNVLLSNDSVNKYNEKAIQASQGSLFSLNIESCNVDKLIDLKKQGYKVIVTVLSKDAINLDNFKFTKNNKYILVFGNEGQGVRKEIIDLADSKIFIEMNNIDSLNVGVASSILLYRLSLDLKK